MPTRTKAEQDRLQRQFKAMEKAIEELSTGLAALRTELFQEAASAAAEPAAGSQAARAATPEPEPAPAANAAPSPPAAEGNGGGPPSEWDQAARFLDAFYHAKGQRLPSRDVSRLAAECGYDARAMAQFLAGPHPALKVSGSDRVLTMAGQRLYLEHRGANA